MWEAFLFQSVIFSFIGLLMCRVTYDFVLRKLPETHLMPTRQASANPIAIIPRRRWQNISTRGILRHFKDAKVKIFLGKVWPMLQSDWSIQRFKDDSIERHHLIKNSQLHKWSLRMCYQKSIGQWTSTPSLELKMTAINVRPTICHFIKPHNKLE